MMIRLLVNRRTAKDRIFPKDAVGSMEIYICLNILSRIVNNAGQESARQNLRYCGRTGFHLNTPLFQRV
jgi:hypothetical protein